MLAYRPNDYEAACAAAVARMRGKLNSGQENLIRERTPASEQYVIDYVAALAEIAVSRIMNLAWTGCGRSDDGSASYDVGGFIQVRSITNPSYGLITREKDDPEDQTVLVYVDTGTRCCSVLGWESNQAVRDQGIARDTLTAKPYWTLPQSRLRPMSELGLVTFAPG